MLLVSVIVPVYNTAPYLEKCVKSIIRQTYPNLEIIIVNDGSTDTSLEICRKYANADSRIVLLSTDNQGLSHARNIGLDIAHGEVISFVDSDDYLHENMYQEMVNCLIAKDADIVICDYNRVDETGHAVFEKNNNPMQKGSIRDKEDMFKLLYEDYVRTVVAWNKLYKKEIFENIRFPLYKIHEDNFVIYDILDKADSIYLLNKKLYIYRERKGSLSQLRDVHTRLDEIQAVDARLDYLAGRKIQDEILNCVVKEALRKRISVYFEIYKKRECVKYKRELVQIVHDYKKIAKKFNVNLKELGMEFWMFIYFPKLAALLEFAKSKVSA